MRVLREFESHRFRQELKLGPPCTAVPAARTIRDSCAWRKAQWLASLEGALAGFDATAERRRRGGVRVPGYV